MDSRFANPVPLGLIGFATTTWLLRMINAGWFDKTSMCSQDSCRSFAVTPLRRWPS